MSAPASRRGFLRGLTTLPLIGGSVALIGAPSAVALPASDDLLDRYLSFLAWEHREAVAERASRREAKRWAGRDMGPSDYPAVTRQDTRDRAPMWWFPEAPGVPALVNGADPSTRAALVLSSLGLSLTA